MLTGNLVTDYLHNCCFLAFYKCAKAATLHISMTSAVVESSHKLMLFIRLHVT